MELSCTNKDYDISVYIEDNKWIVRLDKWFFSPTRPDYAGLHNHSVYEIHFIISGSSMIYIGNRFYPVSADDICFISPGVYHYHHVKSKEEFKMHTIKLIIPSKTKIKECPSTDKTEGILKIIAQREFCVFKDTCGSRQLLNQILNEYKEKAIGFQTNIQALLMHFIIDLARMMAKTDSPFLASPKRISEEFRNEIIDGFFYNSYYRNVTADELAVLIGASKRQLYRILKQLYNMSFKQKLLKDRIEVAKELLKNTDLPIQVISEKVGYSLPANFYSIFEKQTGRTPNQYRTSNR